MEPKGKMPAPKSCDSCHADVGRLSRFEGEDFCDWCYEQVAGHPPDSEPDDVDGRHVIGKLNSGREAIIARVLNGDNLTNEELRMGKFPMPNNAVRELRNQLIHLEPTTRGARRAGRMGDHFDVDVATDGRCHVEIKIANKNGSSPEILKWQPYKDTVQFLQGQLKSANAARFLGDCGEPMFRAWYKEYVAPIAPGTTYEGYTKAVFTIGMKGVQEPASVELITRLREDSAFQKDLQKKWLEFEEKWVGTHEMNHPQFETVIREVIEGKDWWICMSKTQIIWVRGFNVKSVTYAGRGNKRDGGMLYKYTMKLQNKDSGEEKDVPIVLKFHWKNGGQAVQNLNIMVL